MWSLVKRSDIDAAQEQLVSQRAELLRRQAEELARLEADQADLEALDRLARSFSTKFKKTAPAAPLAVVTKKADPPAPPHQFGVSKPRPRTANADRRGVAGT